MKVENKNKKKILIIIATVVILVGVVRISFFKEKDIDYNTKTDPFEMIDLAMEMETELQLEDVQIIEAEGGILEIRTGTPTNVSSDALSVGTAYILGYIEPKIDKDIQKIRIIFTVNYLDAMFMEAERENIKRWTEGGMDDEEFINKFKIVQFSGGGD